MSKSINSNYINTTLGALVSLEKKSIISGPFGSNVGKVFFQKEGIPLIRGNNLSTGQEKFKDIGFVFLTREKANELNCYAIKNDIIFTAVGTIGQVGIIEEKLSFEEYVISNKQLRVRFDTKKIKPLYAYYWFSSTWIQKLILQQNVGSTVPLINLSVLKGLPIRFPKSIVIQEQIVEALETISSKIEINNLINAELEAMAKALYDYWFVQFDFPDKDGKPYKTSGGKMVWDEELKREIPEGWKVKELVEVTSLIMRGISPSYIENGGICVLNQKCIRDKSINFEPGRRHNNDLRDATSRLIHYGDVLVNSTGFGTLGRVAIVKRLKEPTTTVDSHITIVRCENDNIKKLFLGYSMLIRQSEIEGLAEGSTGQTELSRVNLGRLKMVIPPIELQSIFENFINPQFQKMANNEAEIEQLSSLRNWLLPMLMNGQVTVGGSMEKKIEYVIEEEMRMVAETEREKER